MEEKEIIIKYQSFKKSSDLQTPDKGLLDSAKLAVKSSYAPYSHFEVGAAVRLANGEIVKGSNQENSAYPSGLCAERVAIFAAGVQYPGVEIESIAITAVSRDNELNGPVTPCGACCQVMLEAENNSSKPIKIIMHGQDDSCYVTNTVRSVLPFSFDGVFLK